jgi:hypothetical protein
MITKAQQKALKAAYDRMLTFDTPTELTYLQFRRSVRYFPNYIMVRYGSMWLGIETDGYAHT